MNATVRSVSPPPLDPTPSAYSRNLWLAALLVFALGAALRLYPSAGFTGVGFDESLYRDYVVQLDRVGLSNYPAICRLYLDDQRKPDTITKLPPTRFLYVFCGWVWRNIEFRGVPYPPPKLPGVEEPDPALISLHRVSSLFSILLLALAGVCAHRMLGPQSVPAVLALMSFAPTQIHMSQHALIDGFLAFWATMCLWTLWENLRRPNHTGWLAAHGACIALMVLTKENSFFVFVALAGVAAANPWWKFGTVTPRLILVTVAGGAAGVLILAALAGGLGTFVEIYRLLVAKASTLAFAIKTGDGPWYRYLVDLMLVSPIVLCLAIGGVFTSIRGNRGLLYLAAFIAFSYAIMCNVKYGMNLRYATIWDMPLRALAVAQIALMTQRFGTRAALVSTVVIAGICALELRQYQIFFVDFKMYELVTEGLLRAVKILK